MQQWKRVLGYEGIYEVSSDGVVRRCDGYHPSARPLKPAPNHHGYLNVSLSKNGKCKSFFVHRLVCEAFNGARVDGQTINHINGVKTDNSASNLEFVTHAENMRHAVEVIDVMGPSRARGPRNGSVLYPERLSRGVDVATAKLTDEKVREVRRQLAAGGKQRDIAKYVGISQTQVWRINAGLSWAHIR